LNCSIIIFVGYPNLELFITQGGVQFSRVPIKNHVPVIGIPFNSDQTTNSDALNVGSG
jgi:UDP:flavonoid glycosyltransferase YjiC (YdhE family)